MFTARCNKQLLSIWEPQTLKGGL